MLPSAPWDISSHPFSVRTGPAPTLARYGNAPVIPPVQAVGRLGKPDVVAAELRTARTVEGIIFPADRRFKKGAVLVMRREYHTLAFEGFEIAGSYQPHPYSNGRNLRKGQEITVIHGSDATILYAE